MDPAKTGSRKWLLLAAALAITAGGIAGFFDELQMGRGGFVYSPDYIVEGVERGGAAEAAGMQAGDRVISVDGIAAEELPLYSRWPRWLTPGVGESLRIEVERDSETVDFEVVYGATPRGVVHLRIGGGVVALSFLWFGIWALFAVRTSYARGLAYIGLTAGLAALSVPYLGTWSGVKSHVQFASMFLLTVLLLRFFLTFPKPKRAGESRLVTLLLYGVWALFLSLLVLELIFHPRLYHAFGGPGSLIMLVYCMLALVAVVHTLVKMPRGELWSSGMGWILVGLLAAIVPTSVGMIDWALLQGISLPGSNYYPLTLAVFPLSMALAVRQKARADKGGDQDGNTAQATEA
jgi:hypothetical protein